MGRTVAVAGANHVVAGTGNSGSHQGAATAVQLQATIVRAISDRESHVDVMLAGGLGDSDDSIRCRCVVRHSPQAGFAEVQQAALRSIRELIDVEIRRLAALRR